MQSQLLVILEKVNGSNQSIHSVVFKKIYSNSYVRGSWAMEIETFLGPVKWHRAVRRVPFGAQKNRDFQGPTPSEIRI
jgi:hypothetical protein